MTDRELLEAAAKAAFGEAWCYIGESIRVGAASDPWIPLDDDGDAFRLAMQLGMRIALRQAECDNIREFGLEEDALAATRRAIVRAAAAMVKQ